MRFINTKTIKLIVLVSTLVNLAFVGYIVETDQFSVSLLALAGIFEFLVFLFYFVATAYFVWTNHQLNVIQDIHGQHFSGLHRKVAALQMQLKGMEETFNMVSTTLNEDIRTSLNSVQHAIGENSARFGQLRGRLLEEYQVLKKELSLFENHYNHIGNELKEYRNHTEHNLQELNKKSFSALTEFSSAFDKFLAEIEKKEKAYVASVSALSAEIQSASSATTLKFIEELGRSADAVQEAVGKSLNNALLVQQERLGALHSLVEQHQEALSSLENKTADLAKRQEELKLLQQAQKDLQEIIARQNQLDNKELQQLFSQHRATLESLAKTHTALLPMVQATKKQSESVEQILKAQGNGSQEILIKSRADLEKLVQVNQTLLETIHEVRDQTEKQNYGVRQEVRMAYARVDALLSIHKLIDTKVPLPVMDDWAISSDFGLLLIKTILAQPGDVIDIGSGITTILSGYAVKKVGKGKVFSLEHDRIYYNKTRQMIDEHGLSEYITLNFCPLKQHRIKDDSWIWYDIAKAALPKKPTLITVDGPPGNTQELARFPAIPLLRDRITKNTTILLDDALRPDEKRIGEKWENEYKLQSEFISNYKGTLVLRKP